MFYYILWDASDFALSFPLLMSHHVGYLTKALSTKLLNWVTQFPLYFSKYFVGSYIEMTSTSGSLSNFLFIHVFISVWTCISHFFLIHWIIIHYYHTYFNAQFTPDLASLSLFKLAYMFFYSLSTFLFCGTVKCPTLTLYFALAL